MKPIKNFLIVLYCFLCLVGVSTSLAFAIHSFNHNDIVLAQNAKKPQGFSPGMNSQFNEVKQSFDCQCR